MAYIERRRNLWYALLTVPADVRGKLGKLRFVQSLGTPDKTQASILAAPLLARWKAEIREARGTTNAVLEEAGRWRKHLSEQAIIDRQMGDPYGTGSLELHDQLRERIELIAQTKGADEAETLHGIITGRLIPTGGQTKEPRRNCRFRPYYKRTNRPRVRICRR